MLLPFDAEHKQMMFFLAGQTPSLHLQQSPLEKKVIKLGFFGVVDNTLPDLDLRTYLHLQTPVVK